MTSDHEHHATLTVTRDELLVEGDDGAFRAMVHAALAFSARLTSIRDGYAQYVGLTGPQYTILVSIQHLQDTQDIGIKQVAEHLSLSGTFVTTETGKLEEAGLVAKSKGAIDKRRVSLRTTEAGDALLEKLGALQRQVNDTHFGSLSREEFQVLCKVMPELVESSDAGLSLLRHLSRVG